jgi:Nucleotidyltransferase domain
MLARALEQAVSAVFMAWDDPRKPGPKMHQAFDQHLRGLIDPATAVMIGWVWQREGHGPPETDTALLLTACTNVIEYLANLANGAPLPGWQPRPTPAPIGWTSSDGPDRDFLQAALGATHQICPGVRLILFGSRAAGTAQPSRDYDIMFVFPANTPDDRQGQAIGEVNSVARRQGFEVDAAKCTDRDHGPGR